MGELILCSRPLAKFPYHLENVGINIYSLEELCYYIEKNMYLLDESFLDEELCVWIGQELEFPELGERLAAICDRDGTVAEFAECILRETGYFDAVKTGKVVMGLREMAYKSKAERGKLRADRYAAGGRLRYAVYEYRRLLAEWDGENEILCGDIWHNLGCACARMFLFEEAADCYAKAYGKNRNPQSLQECLYARACLWRRQKSLARMRRNCRISGARCGMRRGRWTGRLPYQGGHPAIKRRSQPAGR